MGSAYINAAQANLLQAVGMFDHFHINKLFNEMLTKLRRDLQREAELINTVTFKLKIMAAHEIDYVLDPILHQYIKFRPAIHMLIDFWKID